MIKSKISKITMTLMLVFCMAISMFVVKTNAEDSQKCTKVFKGYAAEKAQKYLNGENTYPKLDGYVFAGWYTTNELPESDVEIANCVIEDNVPDEATTVYALFVPEHVLSVQAQVSAHLIDNSVVTDIDADNCDKTASIRFVTTVDSLLYQKVGFEITYVGTSGSTVNASSESSTVYEHLYVTGSKDTWEETPSSAFCEASKYFRACTITGVPVDYYTTKFTVTPYWVTLSGDKVYGVEATKTMEDGCLRDDVYVSSAKDTDGNPIGQDVPYYGSKEYPYLTLEYALKHVTNGETIHVTGDLIIEEDSWTEHGKVVTITGDGDDSTTETLDCAALSDWCINDEVTFSSINLVFPTARVFANGHKIVIEDTVNITNKVQLFGGSKENDVESTDMEIYAGTYSAIYGGSDYKKVLGDTRVVVGGNVNSTVADYTSDNHSYSLFGGSYKAVVEGNTYVEVSGKAIFNYVYGGGDGNQDQSAAEVKGTTTVVVNGTVNAIYGGGKYCTTSDTLVKVEGGTVYQVYGGCEFYSLNGNADVRISGDTTVKRRIYGGSYNDSDDWTTGNHVKGYATVSVDKDVTLSLSSGLDNSFSALSRTNTVSSEERGVFIFNDYKNNTTNINKIKVDSTVQYFGATFQTHNYLVRATSGGTVLAAGECIYIKPDGENKATVTLTSPDGQVVHYTAGDASYYPLPTVDTTSSVDIYVTFNTTEATDFIASAKATIGTAYYATEAEAIAAAEHMKDAEIVLTDNATQKIASLSIIDSENGTVTSSCKNCIAGTAVTFTVTPDEGYNLTGLDVKKDGVTVDVGITTTFVGGEYEFTPGEGSYTVQATFERTIFTEKTGWNVTTQYDGEISLDSGRTGNSDWIDLYDKYEDIDLTLTVRDYLGDYEAENYVGLCTIVSFNFGDKSAAFRIGYMDSTYKVQTYGNGSIYQWSKSYPLNTDEIKAYQSEQGLEFRIVRSGTDIFLYAGGRRVSDALDLRYDKSNAETYITAATKATVSIKQDGNLDSPENPFTVDMPFKLSAIAPERVTVELPECENGSFATEFKKYLAGDTVKLTVEGDSGYYYDSLAINEEDIIVDWDATHTFEADEYYYKVIGSFAPEIINATTASKWYLINQNVGRLKPNGTVDTGYLETKGNYSVFSMNLKNENRSITEFSIGTQLYFENNAFVSAQIWGKNGSYYLKTCHGGALYGNGNNYHKFTTEQVTALETTGIDFKMVRCGTNLMFYLAGERLTELNVNGTTVDCLDLSHDYVGDDGKFLETPVSSGVTENTNAVFKIRSWSTPIEIPFSLSNVVPATVSFDSSQGTNGTVNSNLGVCLVGDTVTLTATPNEGYDCTGLVIDGIDVTEKAVLNEDGTCTYTIKTTKESYKVEPVYKQRVTISFDENITNGTVVAGSTNYYVGDEVTLTVTPEGDYNCTGLTVKQNDETVELDKEVTITGGTYSFVATEVSYMVEAEFTRKIFKTVNSGVNWDISKQHEGILSVANSDGDSGWVDTLDSTYRDVTLTVRDQGIADESISKEKLRMAIHFQFANNQTYRISILETSSGYVVQDLNSTIHSYSNSKYWTSWYTLNDAEESKIQSEEGIQFRVAIVGTTAKVYLDGTWRCDVDLSTKYYDGVSQETSSGLTADTLSSVSFRFYGNAGNELSVPFKLGGEPQTVTVDIAETTNGTITSDKTEYIVGENVVLTVAGANCDDTDYTNDYYYNSLNVNGEEVIVDSNGNYTFKAAETNTVTGSFAPSIFKSNQAASWDIMNQHKGVVYQKADVTGNAPNLDLVGSRVNSDTSIIIKAGEDDFNEDGTLKDKNGDRTAICYWSSTATVGFGINLHTDGKYYIGNSAGYNGYDQGIHMFTEEETKLIKEEGIELRVIRIGSEAHIYLDGKFITTYALPYAEDEVTTTFIKRWDDGGVRAPIGYKFTEADPTPVTLNFATTENGSFSGLKDYIVGEQVTIKAEGAEGYACNYITVDGEPVSLEADGTYTFKATKASYEIAGTFAEVIFSTVNSWNVSGQFFGHILAPSTLSNGTGWGKTTGNLTEISAVVKDYTGGTGTFGFVENLSFAKIKSSGNDWVSIRLTDIDRTKGDYALVSMNDSLYGYKVHYNLNEEEEAKVIGEGIEFKMVRVGTSLNLYLDGKQVATLDLTQDICISGANYYETSIDSEITATTEITDGGFRLYGNAGYDMVVPYTFVKEEPTVVSISETQNGIVTLASPVYYLGDTVTLTGTSKNGYV
ncbi:MAG: hypothetical protein IJE60_11810 [Tyzzerella sp.]|nr:hypothetical protein [Tyzzerella sp.]